MEHSCTSVGAFLIRNQDLIMGLLVWPFITAILNVALRKKTPEQWEAWALSKPALAFVFEVMRASGVDLFKVLQAFHRFAQRRAGMIPADAVRVSSLPEPLKAALRNPETVKLLVEAAAKFQEAQTSDSMMPEPTEN
jgi:hypothetical protein